jgi:hypothetical protein
MNPPSLRNAILPGLAGGLLLLGLGNGAAWSQDSSGLADSIGRNVIPLEALTSEQLIKIRNAVEMELVYGDSTGLTRHAFSKETADWDVEGHVLLIPGIRSLPPASFLRTIRIKSDPNLAAALLVGIPTGLVLTAVITSQFPEDPHRKSEFFHFPPAPVLAAVGVGTFVVGPLVAYHLMGRWQSIYIVQDSRSGWRRAFQHEE